MGSEIKKHMLKMAITAGASLTTCSESRRYFSLKLAFWERFTRAQSSNLFFSSDLLVSSFWRLLNLLFWIPRKAHYSDWTWVNFGDQDFGNQPAWSSILLQKSGCQLLKSSWALHSKLRWTLQNAHFCSRSSCAPWWFYLESWIRSFASWSPPHTRTGSSKALP